jgi:hypothetical protein
VHLLPQIMKEAVGLDVTREILGMRGVEQGVVMGAHRHSAKAWTAIHKLVVAYVSLFPPYNTPLSTLPVH